MKTIHLLPNQVLHLPWDLGVTILTSVPSSRECIGGSQTYIVYLLKAAQ